MNDQIEYSVTNCTYKQYANAEITIFYSDSENTFYDLFEEIFSQAIKVKLSANPVGYLQAV